MRCRCVLLLISLAASLSAWSAEPAIVPADNPAVAGPHRVLTADLVLRDDARKKDLPVFVSYPGAEGQFPVIVFSHGALGSGDMQLPIVTHWTSHGYVVLCPTHSDSLKLRRGRGEVNREDVLREIRRGGQEGGWDQLWTERPQDVSFVLDSLDAIEEKVPALRGKLDRQRVGVGGHSLGAYTAQVAGGATVMMPNKAEPQSFADPRVKAILQLSGQGTDQQGLFEGSWKDIRMPMMCVTGSRDRAAKGQDPSWRKEPFTLSPPGDKYFLFIEGASHFSFTGRVAEYTPEQEERFRDFMDNAGQRARRGGKRGEAGAAGAAATDQKAIFAWVKYATTVFWGASLKGDANAQALLAPRALEQLSDGKAKLETR